MSRQNGNLSNPDCGLLSIRAPLLSSSPLLSKRVHAVLKDSDRSVSGGARAQGRLTLGEHEEGGG